MFRLKIDPSVSFCYGKGWRDLPIEVLDGHGLPDQSFDLMCMAIFNDIESAEGSGADFLKGLRQIESGETNYIAADGNAWIAFITPDVVWFEGLYNQGEGGAVTFRQYKLAVETYVRFLADPEHKPIEVPFPDDPTPAIPDVSAIVAQIALEKDEAFRVYCLNSRDREVVEALKTGERDETIAARLRMDLSRLQLYRVEVLQKSQSKNLGELYDLIERVELRASKQG